MVIVKTASKTIYYDAMTDREQTADDTMSTLEKEVREEVEEIKGFYIHLGIYAIVNVFLIVLNLITSPEYLWAIWPLLGWGVGLGSHAVATFGLFGIGSQAWQERKVRALMLQRQRGLSAEQVRQLLREEMHADAQTTDPTDLERTLQRLENLEAIVTSQEWEQLDAPPEAAPPRLEEADLDDQEATQDPSEHTARLARRVR